MSQMSDLEKLRIMLPHWIEHNQGHGDEFQQWAERLGESDAEMARLLQSAVRSLRQAQSALEEALAKAGGPLQGPHHGPHGHHGHHH